MLNNTRALLQYNSRILLANSYWLLIIPLVASQLVIFWHMAVASCLTLAMVAKTCELFIPLLAAFMCAHIVAPEHRNRVDELTFVRPVPFTRTIALRALALYTIITVLAVVMMYVYKVGLKQDIDLGQVLLAGAPSVLFLSMLSLALASSWRSPAVGIGAALVYWLADAWKGSAFNPIFTLYSYATALGDTEEGATVSPDWVLSKAALLCLSLILLWITVKGLQCPASPKRWRSIVRLLAGALIVSLVYLVSGALWQFKRVGEQAVAEPAEARVLYEQTFQAYGPVPVPYLFGPAFARYVGYPPSAHSDAVDFHKMRQETLARLQAVAARWPDSPWADDALFELIRLRGVKREQTVEARRENRITLEHCRRFLDQYSTGPFAPLVTARIVVLARALGDDETMMWAYRRVTKVYGGTEAAAEAAAELRAHYLETGQVEKAIEAARLAAESAPPESRPEALLELAGFLAGSGRKAEARQIFSQVESAVQAKLEALGLAILTLDNATPENFALRAEIVRLRSKARQGLQALDQPPAPPAPSPAQPQ